MARYLFGGDFTAWVFTPDGSDVPVLTGGATITAWNAETGGTQYVDLQTTSGGAIDSVTSEDGTGARTKGVIPPFYGPPDVLGMWISADGGPRSFLISPDVASVLGPQLVTLASNYNGHITAANPHAMDLDDVADVDAAAPVDGEVLQWSATAGRWVSATVAGVSGTMTRSASETVTGTKTFQPSDVNNSGIVLQTNVGQVGDILACFSSDGKRTGYFNEKGELRCIAAAANSVAVRFKGQPGQTANILEITDTANNPVSWVDAAGRFRAPNAGMTWTFSRAGNLATGTGTFRVYNDTGVQLTIRAIRASVGTAPATQPVIIDVNKNGSTIFTTQANRPSIAAGANTSGKVTNANTITIDDGQYLTVDIDQIGSGTVGADLVVQVLVY